MRQNNKKKFQRTSHELTEVDDKTCEPYKENKSRRGYGNYQTGGYCI